MATVMGEKDGEKRAARLTRAVRHNILPGIMSATMGGHMRKLLDRIATRLDSGSITAHFPGGIRRKMGGHAPGFDAEIYFHRWRGLARIIWRGSLGLYEGWEAGEWESPDPVAIFALFMANRESLGNIARPSPLMRAILRIAHIFHGNSHRGARRNIEFHYDLGNDFYRLWLDPTMTYSSALFSGLGSDAGLEAAQKNKISKLLERLRLKSGDSLLEIGCGWGGLAEQAVRDNGIVYHGITLSPRQKDFADTRLAPFADRAKITLTDYRDVRGQYDAIASVEMVEAVGREYWGAYLDAIARNLKNGGRAAIQYISIDDAIFEAYARNVDFIQHYIFPGGMLLSEKEFFAAARERGLEPVDRTGFALDYAQTLLMWRKNFDAVVAAGKLPAGFDEKFIRLWRFYLMYCEGGFRSGGIDVAQITLIKS